MPNNFGTIIDIVDVDPCFRYVFDTCHGVRYDKVEVRIGVHGVLTCTNNQGDIWAVVSYVDEVGIGFGEVQLGLNITSDTAGQSSGDGNDGGRSWKKGT